VIGNYQVTGMRSPGGAARNESGVAFLQKSGQGCGGQGARSDRTGGRGMPGADVGGGALVSSGGEQGQARRTNQAGDSYCYNRGSLDYWTLECPELSSKQQAQLHMVVQGNKDQGKEVDEGHQPLNVSLLQGEAFPDNRAYLNGCLTVTAFKTDKYLQNIKTVARGIRNNCIAGTVVMDKKGLYGQLNVWYFPKRNSAHLFHARAGETVSYHLQQLGGLLLRAHAQGGGQVPQGQAGATIY
jgi:hypothetical protein